MNISVKDKYGIVFRSQIGDGVKRFICDVTNPKYYNLSFINLFDAWETAQWIGDLNLCILHQFNIQDFYESDTIENTYTIEYQYPNMVIDDGIITIPMTDVKELLQDWLVFITQSTTDSII